MGSLRSPRVIMGDLTQVQLLPVESGTAKRGEPDLTEQEIAPIVTAGAGDMWSCCRTLPAGWKP